MPIRTGRVTAMRDTVFYNGPRWHAEYATTRYEVFLWTPGFSGTLPLYTTDPWRASLCREARRTQQSITAETRDTFYGEEILSVELTPTEGAAAQSRASDPMGDSGEPGVDPSRGTIGSIRS